MTRSEKKAEFRAKILKLHAKERNRISRLQALGVVIVRTAPLSLKAAA